MTENQSGAGAPPDAPHEPPGDGSTGPRVTREEMRDLTRLRRHLTDRHIAGVSGGIGRHFDIDPVIVRVAFVVLTFFGGAGLFLYGALWLLVPEDHAEKAKFNLDPRTRNVALIGVGVLAALVTIGDLGDWHWFPWPLIFIGFIAWLIISRRDRRANRVATYGGGPTAGWVGTAGAPGAPTGSSATYAEQPPTTGITPPMPPYTIPAPKPRNPRKRGPLLFWFTLPLLALGLGLLGVADASGVDVTDSAYPALALGLIASMLLFGAFWGRAGGLIFLGLIALVGTAGATAAEHWDGQERHSTPLTSAAVKSNYDLDGPGELVLDLTKVTDLRRLDGRTIEIDAGVGRIEVIVPNTMSVTVDAEVGGPGDISVFGDHDDGIHVELTGVNNAVGSAPQVHIDAFIGVGEIEVKSE